MYEETSQKAGFFCAKQNTASKFLYKKYTKNKVNNFQFLNL